MKFCKPDYLDQALLLSEEQQERVLSRIRGKLARKLRKGKIAVDVAIGLQLEIEDEQLQAWRSHQTKRRHQDALTNDTAQAGDAPQPASADPTKKAKRAKPKTPKRVTLASITPADWEMEDLPPPSAQPAA